MGLVKRLRQVRLSMYRQRPDGVVVRDPHCVQEGETVIHELDAGRWVPVFNEFGEQVGTAWMPSTPYGDIHR